MRAERKEIIEAAHHPAPQPRIEAQPPACGFMRAIAFRIHFDQTDPPFASSDAGLTKQPCTNSLPAFEGQSRCIFEQPEIPIRRHIADGKRSHLAIALRRQHLIVAAAQQCAQFGFRSLLGQLYGLAIDRNDALERMSIAWAELADTYRHLSKLARGRTRAKQSVQAIRCPAAARADAIDAL